MFTQAIVQHALALDHAFLFRVEGGGIVLEILNQGTRLWPFIKNLGLALIDHSASGHLVQCLQSGCPEPAGARLAL